MLIKYFNELKLIAAIYIKFKIGVTYIFKKNQYHTRTHAHTIYS